ncbi:hypothetical protein [Parabacteroides sp. AM08-6]|uniref:hypothetical protein n=1 Tax=Parabacteroides sp. AM08-6 TaxID=2292053 RepID=UPI000EFDED02|nr:hypothetical protein [Parabacteroides sp. AM08-6]RHJ75750.1 hypothetical protein DW103_17400 [Parabacteroides sp. AM08-6]
MKKILPLLGIIMLLLSCSRVEHIQSLSQLEPALRKHVGSPSRIDTVLEDKEHFTTYNRIGYHYDNVADVSFKQLVVFLSKAYDSKPVLNIKDKHSEAEFVLIPDKDIYMIQVVEWYGSKDNKRHLGFVILDVNNELVIPSSQRPQTAAPSK